MIECGGDGVNTARVAERAGVSIGSLYQYFPNKQALIASLVELHASRIVSLVEDTLRAPADITLEEGLRALIRTALDTRRLAVKLHKILNEQASQLKLSAEVNDASRRIAESIEQFLRVHSGRLPPDCDPVIAAQVIESSLEALTHRLVMKESEKLSCDVVGGEMYRLFSGYLAL